MRNLFIIAVLLVAAFMAGWFRVHREGDQTTIQINRAEIRDDARRAIDRGRDFLDQRDQRFAEQGQPPLHDEFGHEYWPLEQIAVQPQAYPNGR